MEDKGRLNEERDGKGEVLVGGGGGGMEVMSGGWPSGRYHIMHQPGP